MKTKEEMTSKGYKEDWIIKCDTCESYNCHAYNDKVICFDCFKKNETIKNNKPSKLPSSVWDKLELTKLGHTNI